MTTPSPAGAQHPNALQRQQLLQRLYAAREAKPGAGWLFEHDLAQACGEIAFALDMLADLSLVQREGFRVRITGAGVLACEAGWREGGR